MAAAARKTKQKGIIARAWQRCKQIAALSLVLAGGWVSLDIMQRRGDSPLGGIKVPNVPWSSLLPEWASSKLEQLPTAKPAAATDSAPMPTTSPIAENTTRPTAAHAGNVPPPRRSQNSPAILASWQEPANGEASPEWEAREDAAMRLVGQTAIGAKLIATAVEDDVTIRPGDKVEAAGAKGLYMRRELSVDGVAYETVNDVFMHPSLSNQDIAGTAAHELTHHFQYDQQGLHRLQANMDSYNNILLTRIFEAAAVINEAKFWLEVEQAGLNPTMVEAKKNERAIGAMMELLRPVYQNGNSHDDSEALLACVGIWLQQSWREAYEISGYDNARNTSGTNSLRADDIMQMMADPCSGISINRSDAEKLLRDADFRGIQNPVIHQKLSTAGATGPKL